MTEGQEHELSDTLQARFWVPELAGADYALLDKSIPLEQQNKHKEQ